ncbi:hypothetical protein D3C73_1451670 [compost metagenome]
MDHLLPLGVNHIIFPAVLGQILGGQPQELSFLNVDDDIGVEGRKLGVLAYPLHH